MLIKKWMRPLLLAAIRIKNILYGRFLFQSKEPDAIGILGRGISLIHAQKLNGLSEFIIVNQFHNELSREPVRTLLNGKKIIHFVNYGEDVLPLNLLARFYVDRYQCTLFRPNGSERRHRRPRGNHRHIERIGYKAHYLPEFLEKDLDFSQGYNTGLLAILYAIKVLNKKRIFLAGFDFYETNYFADPGKLQKDLDRLGERYYQRSEIVKRGLLSLMEKYPQTSFTVYTEADFETSFANVTILRSGKKVKNLCGAGYE